MKAATTKTLTDPNMPYEAFWEGFVDQQRGQHRNPYADMKNHGDEAQAWGSGQEAALRVADVGY